MPSMNLTRFGILVFAVAVVLGPWYSVEGYSHTANLISELGAQHTPNRFIMVLGFLCLGGGILVNGVQPFSIRALPFAAFGGFMLLASLFPHMPLDPSLPHDPVKHEVHGLMAIAAGISVTAGMLWQACVAPGRTQRITAGALAVICVVMPLLMLAWPEVQGLTQRLMYLAVFAWLWCYFPARLGTARMP
jgi:hypothetical membrane protein